METFICLAAGFLGGWALIKTITSIGSRNLPGLINFFGGCSMAYVFYKVFL